MSNRKNLRYRRSRKMFSRSAGLNGMHRKNRLSKYVFRGGVRL